MSLYLCVFGENGDELDGVEVGAYSDFGTFRRAVAELNSWWRPKRFRTLLEHSDCDGEWSVEQCQTLIAELDQLAEGLRRKPPHPLSGFQKSALEERGIAPGNLYDCFIDVDGEPLVARLRGLAELAIAKGRPISFQ